MKALWVMAVVAALVVPPSQATPAVEQTHGAAASASPGQRGFDITTLPDGALPAPSFPASPVSGQFVSTRGCYTYDARLVYQEDEWQYSTGTKTWDLTRRARRVVASCPAQPDARPQS